MARTKDKRNDGNRAYRGRKGVQYSESNFIMTKGRRTETCRNAAFNTTELLEEMIVQLKPAEVMPLRLVCRRADEVIRKSSKVHEAMFLRLCGTAYGFSNKNSYKVQTLNHINTCFRLDQSSTIQRNGPDFEQINTLRPTEDFLSALNQMLQSPVRMVFDMMHPTDASLTYDVAVRINWMVGGDTHGLTYFLKPLRAHGTTIGDVMREARCFTHHAVNEDDNAPRREHVLTLWQTAYPGREV